MDRRAAGDGSDGGGSSSSSSDSVLIPMPLDQRHRKKLQAQLQLEQQRQREKRADADRDRDRVTGRDAERDAQEQKKKVKQERRADTNEPPGRKKVAFKVRVGLPARLLPPTRAVLTLLPPQSEHICVVCERGDGEPLVACAGPCVSAFHVSCLPSDEQAVALGSVDADAKTWLCHYCRAKRHECFHCKEISAEQASGEEDEAPIGAGGDPAASAKGPVRKCRALSCGKYYHLDCITQFPLARIAGTHFICPVRLLLPL
jgi:hypothetical protein